MQKQTKTKRSISRDRQIKMDQTSIDNLLQMRAGGLVEKIITFFFDINLRFIIYMIEY